AVELPVRGPAFARFRPHGSAYWGQPELVSAIAEAAQEVASSLPGGPPLVLGDLSDRFGGRVPRHNSHRSGRDVDLLWYLVSLDNEPVRATGFLHVGNDGMAHEPGSG